MCTFDFRLAIPDRWQPVTSNRHSNTDISLAGPVHPLCTVSLKIRDPTHDIMVQVVLMSQQQYLQSF